MRTKFTLSMAAGALLAVAAFPAAVEETQSISQVQRSSTAERHLMADRGQCLKRPLIAAVHERTEREFA